MQQSSGKKKKKKKIIFNLQDLKYVHKVIG